MACASVLKRVLIEVSAQQAELLAADELAKGTGVTHTHHGHVDHHNRVEDKGVAHASGDNVNPHFVLYDYSMDDSPLPPLKSEKIRTQTTAPPPQSKPGGSSGGGGGSGGDTAQRAALDALDAKLRGGVVSQSEYDSILQVMSAGGRLSPADDGGGGGEVGGGGVGDSFRARTSSY